MQAGMEVAGIEVSTSLAAGFRCLSSGIVVTRKGTKSQFRVRVLCPYLEMEDLDGLVVWII